MSEALSREQRRAPAGGLNGPSSRPARYGLLLLLGLGLAGCGYHLGPPQPAQSLNCCRPSGAN